MIDTLLHRLHMAIEHRGVRANPEPMRDAVDVEPSVRCELVGAQKGADPGRENLGSAARKAAEAGIDHIAQRSLHGDTALPGDVLDLHSRVGLNVDRRELIMDHA